MGKVRTSRGRSWCFTVNNFSDDDVLVIRRLEQDRRIRYLVLQEELASTGTRHLQGYLEAFRPLRLGLCRKLISPRVHWEQRLGTQAEAIAYCKKLGTRTEDGVVIEFGTPARSKCSVDLVQSVLDGASMKDLALDYPVQFMANSGGIKALKEQIVEVRSWTMEVIVFWGATGTGKTFSAWQLWPEAYSVSWPVGGTWWWQDYDGEETVICDEFADQIKLQTMLRFLDRSPFRVFYKGGSTQFRSKRIVLCSNFDPQDWYSGAKTVGRDALMRRLKEFATVYEFPSRFRGVGVPEHDVDMRFEEITILESGPDDSSSDESDLSLDGRDGQESPLLSDDFTNFGFLISDSVDSDASANVLVNDDGDINL